MQIDIRLKENKNKGAVQRIASFNLTNLSSFASQLAECMGTKMRNSPKPQEIYKHFKGNLYRIITLAKNTESDEQMVIYQAMCGEFKVYARPLHLFMGKTDKSKYPDAIQEDRFELQSDLIESAGIVQPSFKQMSEIEMQAQEMYDEARETSQFEEARETSQEEKTEKIEKNLFIEKNLSIEENLSMEGIYSQEGKYEDESEHLIDPMLMEFLGADSYERRLQILSGLHHRLTDNLINTMAISIDIEIKDGDLEDRYAQLRNCLLTLKRFERNR